MKMLKKIKTDMWINVFMMLLIGILFIVRPQDSLESNSDYCRRCNICKWYFWPDLLLAGLDRLLFKRFSVWGIMKCVLGIFIFTHAGITTVLFSYVFSIYIIINGIICMETAIYMQRAFEVNCRKYVILSCFVVLGGIIMMFFSPNTVKTAAIMTGIIFIINAVIDGVILYHIQKISRQSVEKFRMP